MSTPPLTPTEPTEFPKATYDEWRARVEDELGPERSFEDTLVQRSLAGLTVEPLYVAPSAEGAERRAAESQASRRERGGWTVAQRVSHPSPTVANRHALDEVENGATGLALDVAPSHGKPATGPGERPFGIEIQDVEDLEGLLEGLVLDAVPITFGTNADAVPLASSSLAVCERRGIDAATVAFHFGFDPLATAARDGALPGDLADARREMALLVGYSRMKLDRSRALCVDAGVWQQAGAHAVQELTYAAASFIEMLRWLEKDGIPTSASHVEFVWRFDVGQDLCSEVAKLRAARALHARILGAHGIEEAVPLALHATTATRCFTTTDPWTNMIRGAHATLAAGLGGADLVTVVPFDADVHPSMGPSDLGRRVARNTQLVLLEEARLDHVGDPLGGAYSIEARTDALARAAWEGMRAIERNGGMAAHLERGAVASELDTSRAAIEDALGSGDRTLLGVTRYAPPADRRRSPAPTAFDVDVERRARAARLAARGDVVIGSIDSLEHAVRAAAHGATLAELGGALVRGAPWRRDPLPSPREEELAPAVEALAGGSAGAAPVSERASSTRYERGASR